MTNFLQLHILTTYAASNLNRDDTGRPKTLNFGGAERVRVSSQSLKRAFRTSDVFADAVGGTIATTSGYLGTRTQNLVTRLVDQLTGAGKSKDEALTLVSKALAKATKKSGSEEYDEREEGKCQRRRDIASTGRSKSAAGMCKQEGPLEGAFLLAARYS